MIFINAQTPDILTESLSPVKDLIDTYSQLIEAYDNMSYPDKLEPIMEGLVKNIWEAIKQFFRNLINKIKSFFSKKISEFKSEQKSAYAWYLTNKVQLDQLAERVKTPIDFTLPEFKYEELTKIYETEINNIYRDSEEMYNQFVTALHTVGKVDIMKFSYKFGSEDHPSGYLRMDPNKYDFDKLKTEFIEKITLGKAKDRGGIEKIISDQLVSEGKPHKMTVSEIIKHYTELADTNVTIGLEMSIINGNIDSARNKLKLSEVKINSFKFDEKGRYKVDDGEFKKTIPYKEIETMFKNFISKYMAHLDYITSLSATIQNLIQSAYNAEIRAYKQILDKVRKDYNDNPEKYK